MGAAESSDTKEFEFDLFVIGAGSGGVRAARMAAATGASVAVAEERYLGGTCVNVGCVPKKLFVYASHFAEDFESSQGFGWSPAVSTHDWPTLRDNKTAEIQRLNGIYQTLLDNAGVRIIEGRAEVIDANTVKIGETQFSCKRILLAMGGWPSVPDIPGKEHVIDSNQVFYLEHLPKKPVVIGGGYIGVEFAGIFNGLGCETTLLYRGTKLLKRFDQDLGEHVMQEMAGKGIDIRLETDVSAINDVGNGQYELQLSNGEVLQCDCVMYATGRVPLLEEAGVNTLNLDMTANGKIAVNDSFETSVPGVYALGDIIDSPELTPVAIAEAMVFVDRVYKNSTRTLDYSNIPTAVFCQPSIGTVGLSESEARQQYENVKTYRSEFRALKNTLSGSSERTFMKMIVDSDTDRVLGVHMVGPDAGEITQGMGVALKAGATKSDFDETIGIHPTSAEEFVTMRTADE
ncbi:MAG: glutathione-disulfide reductase [Pseudomonadales bacterium]